MNNPFIPECEQPILLINRASLNEIRRGGSLYIDGVRYVGVSSSNVFSRKLSYYYRLIKKDDKTFSYDDIKRFVVRNRLYEDYLFMLVPCNRCVLCKQKKQNEYVFRASMEQVSYDVPPYFFTLTYKPDCLPYHGELRYKDVQDFFKRLRRMWDRKGLKHSVRYIVSGEYGHKKGRPHYHVILYNNPYGASEAFPVLHRMLEKDVFDAWLKMEWQSYDFGQCHGGAVAYAVKYISKIDIDLHGHWIKPFVHASCGNGGIGSAFLDSQIKLFRENVRLREITFRDYNGNIQKVSMGQYAKSRLWPSPVRCVPARVKNFYKQYVDVLILMVRYGILTVDDADAMSERIRPYKSVLANRFSPLDCKDRLYCCSTALRYYLKPRFFRLLDDLGVELSEICDVDEKYIEKYFEFKNVNNNQIIIDLGWKKMKSREKKVLQDLKEKL